MVPTCDGRAGDLHDIARDRAEGDGYEYICHHTSHALCGEYKSILHTSPYLFYLR